VDFKGKVLGVGKCSEIGLQVGVFCLEGSVRVGDRLRVLIDEEGDERAVDLEVLEIQFFERTLDKVEPPIQVNMLLAGDGLDTVTPESMLGIA
jgi:hypothetical protein